MKITVIATEILFYGRIECPNCKLQQEGPEHDEVEMKCRGCEHLMEFRFCQSELGLCDRRAAIRVRAADEVGRVLTNYVCSGCYVKTPALLGAVIEVQEYPQRRT